MSKKKTKTELRKFLNKEKKNYWGLESKLIKKAHASSSVRVKKYRQKLNINIYRRKKGHRHSGRETKIISKAYIFASDINKKTLKIIINE